MEAVSSKKQEVKSLKKALRVRTGNGEVETKRQGRLSRRQMLAGVTGRIRILILMGDFKNYVLQNPNKEMNL